MFFSLNILSNGPLFAVVVFFAAVLCGCSENDMGSKWPIERKVSVMETSKPIPIKHSRELRFHGIVKGYNSVPLNFFESGRIESLKVREGQVVKQGQEIATLYSPSLADKLSQAQTSLEKAKAKLKVDVEDLARNIKLFNKGIISKQVLEQSKKSFDVSTQDKKEAEAVVKTRKKELSELSIISQEEGMVSKLFKRNGDFLIAGEPLLQFDSTSRQKISYQVPEKVAINLAVGETNNVYLFAMDKVISAVLVEKSHPTESNQFLHTLTYTFESNDLNLIGLRTTLVLSIEETLAHKIDYKALRYDRKGHAYAIKMEDELAKMPLTVLDLKENSVVVKADFEPNDHIILGNDASMPVDYSTF